MYQIAQGILNRPLSTTEITTLYSMYDWLGLPREVVLMIFGALRANRQNKYAIHRKRLPFRGRKKGIDTLDKAKAHLRAAKRI
ncbi:MAG: DnaD domain protein [Clostridiales bacterium]|nr:MAG: DnaD domain protein [Clostridiales bacterium]